MRQPWAPPGFADEPVGVAVLAGVGAPYIHVAAQPSARRKTAPRGEGIIEVQQAAFQIQEASGFRRAGVEIEHKPQGQLLVQIGQ